MRELQRWPDLFKKSTSNGKISVWRIWVEGSTIHTEAGYQGQKMKPSKDTVAKGKNIGRSNETTPHEQAVSEAQSKFNKYKDRGYVEDLKKIRGPSAKITHVTPMLAQDYTKHGSKLSFPLYAQPKLDGMRANKYGKKAPFVSRSNKPLAKLKGLNYVADAIRETTGYDLDGELYNHELREGFSKIISGARTAKGENSKESLIQYHVYDIIAPKLTFRERHEILAEAMFKHRFQHQVKMVETVIVESQAELLAYHASNLKAGYEGTMVRDPEGLYEIDKRSYTLQKFKPFQDSEFRIVGVTEGRGKLKGAVGAFILEISDERGKRTFESKMIGAGVTDFLKKAWKDHSIWKGKWMHVRYRGYTDKNFVPRENRSIRIRDVE